jgi:hypothetical protein
MCAHIVPNCEAKIRRATAQEHDAETIGGSIRDICLDSFSVGTRSVSGPGSLCCRHFRESSERVILDVPDKRECVFPGCPQERSTLCGDDVVIE